MKGPVGMGLQMEPSGTHIAFCGGTGVLVFLDLVAHLLLKNCFEKDSRKVPEQMQFYQDDF